jgi:mannose-1-phosphate guanylyltransferase/mannose-6-phosphate isomerase
MEVGADGVAGNILLEPEPKNTAPAVGLGALHMAKAERGCIMAVLPSDHVIRNVGRFHAALKKAGKLARDGWLVVFGIRPARPETGYGYIKQAVSLGDGAFEVRRFVEKPDRETAGRYLESGDYLWNSGMFVWKAETVLGEIRKQMPGLYKGLGRIRDAMGRMVEEFARLEPVSIDYGVMEKASKVAVLPVDFGWSDLGSWDAVGEVIPPDADGNVTVGRVVSMGCRDTTVFADNRLVATVGLSDAVVVDTPDATLVCRKDMAQNVKDVVGVLKEKGYCECVSHQMHYHRSEHWIVVSGTALVTNGERVYNVHVNESTYIPMSTMHRLENPGKVPLQIIEVQNGEYLEEDDIVRFDDVYGRA